MSQADGERRHVGGRIALHRFEADPGLVGGTGAGRDDHALIVADVQLVDRGVVVAHDLDRGAELAQVLDQVVGEAVVVVEHEHAHAADVHAHSSWATASSTAWTTARALATDSSNS